MATITLRNVLPLLHERLKRRAEAHRRSLSSEVLALLEEEATGQTPADREELLERIRALRRELPPWDTSSEELKKIMREGLA